MHRNKSLIKCKNVNWHRKMGMETVTERGTNCNRAQQFPAFQRLAAHGGVFRIADKESFEGRCVMITNGTRSLASVSEDGRR